MKRTRKPRNIIYTSKHQDTIVRKSKFDMIDYYEKLAEENCKEPALYHAAMQQAEHYKKVSLRAD